MPESQHREPEDYAHTSPQIHRDMHDADDQYSIAVFIVGKQYVATQADATLKARGFSAAEAITNFRWPSTRRTTANRWSPISSDDDA